MSLDETTSDDQSWIKAYAFKRQLQSLDSAHGAGTSLITLLIPPKTQVSDIQSMITREMGTASNIKSRVNRHSVEDALKWASERLKQFRYIPDTGLALLVGLIDCEGKPEKTVLDIIPPKPLKTFVYRCDNQFHIQPLREMLVDDKRYGFIIVNGEETLYAYVSGNQVDEIGHFSVSLPPKHGRGGQSALRFARHAEEARHNYIRKICETANRLLIENDRPTVCGIILAGSAQFKDHVSQSDLLDPRLRAIILATYDIQYGAREGGLRTAINMASGVLAEARYAQELRVLDQFFTSINKADGMVIYGHDQTLKALEDGRIKVLILWDGHSLSDQLFDQFQSGGLSSKLEMVGDQTSLGTQFKDGFGGIGGLLHYPIGDDEQFDFEPLEDGDLEDLGL